ncbi:MAG: SDR family NAD(P)-dependent oxidoreductase [Microbacterium sp.]|uniref:SDR family NAD(P)-dependent oxidoreductase n=1 Tax=Microbacterium sp. TaxID=51671 RepID=UPI003A843C3E
MQTIIITGASDGIGAAAARQLAGEGRRLVLVGRSAEKTRAVAAETRSVHHVADFTRLDDVRDLAQAFLRECDRIDVLANNAGGIFAGPARTVDGFEKTFQVNHLAPYLLTYLLRDRLIASRAAIVNTSSIGARLFGRIDLDDIQTWNRYRPNRAYGNAKLANILFTKGLHNHFHDQGLSSVAFHPGNVATSFASDTTSYFRWVYHSVLSRFLISPEQGGVTLAHFISGTPDATWASGAYYNDRRKIGRTNKQASDPAIVAQHWNLSAQLLDIAW